MKFKKVGEDVNMSEERRSYLVWEREDNKNIVITKTKGTKVYWVENLETGFSFDADSLEFAKSLGEKL